MVLIPSKTLSSPAPISSSELLETRIEALSLEQVGSGSNNKNLERFLEEAPFKKGQIFSSKEYETFKIRWLSKAYALGYLNAYWIDHRVILNRTTNRVAIHLVLDSGPLFHIGPLHYTPLAHWSPEDFQKLSSPSVQPGQVYRQKELFHWQQALMNTDLFTKVRFIPQMDPERFPNTVPLQVKLETKKNQHLWGGLGYGTDTKTRISLGHTYRVPTRPGHRINLQARFSAPLQNLEARYTWPGHSLLYDQWEFRLRHLESHWEGRYSAKLDGQLQFTQKRSRHVWTWFLNHFKESYQLSLDDPKQKGDFLMPGLKWSYRKHKKHEGQIQSGFSLSGEARSSLRQWGSKISFHRLDGQLKWIRPMDVKNRLHFRQTLGAILHSPIEAIPISLRYFAGGNQSVRGYTYHSLGPRNAAGIVTGGRYLSTSSVEWEHLIEAHWSAALFADWGNAMNSFHTHLKSSIGVGLRFKTLLGPLSLDVALPQQDKRRRWRLLLNFGMEL